MTPYLARSRVSKALTDADLAHSFAEAEARLDAVSPCVLIDAAQALTAAGQSAALTAVVTAVKCFGRVQLAGSGLDTSLLQPLLAGGTLGAAARALGANVTATIEPGCTHLIRIGATAIWRGWQTSLWWNRWLAGTRRFEEPLGSSALGLAGIFAGALAVRQIFAHLRGGTPARDETVSLWEPNLAASPDRIGPPSYTIPSRLWLIGLGHLGQACVWGLLTIPFTGDRYIILQDDQHVGVENGPTSVLVGGDDLGRRKVRVAARWLDEAGWTTELIERRHQGDIRLGDRDPAILIAGLDDVRPRQMLAAQGFDYMIDMGIGRGTRDFESLQVRTLPKGARVDALWLAESTDSTRERLQAREAYKNLEQEVGLCGTVPLADASVAVPFVGAATAALAVAQLARLGAMAPAQAMLQLELGAPALVIDGGTIEAPSSFLGGETFELE